MANIASFLFKAMKRILVLFFVIRDSLTTACRLSFSGGAEICQFCHPESLTKDLF